MVSECRTRRSNARIRAESDDIVGVVTCGDHDDRHVALAADGPAHLKSVDTRQHDVDEHHVGRVVSERHDGLLAVDGLVDLPALVLKRQTYSGPDAFVVFNGQNSRSHSHIVAHRAPERGYGLAPPLIR